MENDLSKEEMKMAERKGTDQKLVSRVFKYNETVQYQEGSIVSRTIIDKDEGTVTLFAFDEGQRLSTHSAPFDALVQIVDGTGIIRIEEEEFEVPAPGAIIMPTDKPHSVAGKGQFKMVLTMIRVKN